MILFRYSYFTFYITFMLCCQSTYFASRGGCSIPRRSASFSDQSQITRTRSETAKLNSIVRYRPDRSILPLIDSARMDGDDDDERQAAVLLTEKRRGYPSIPTAAAAATAAVAAATASWNRYREPGHRTRNCRLAYPRRTNALARIPEGQPSTDTKLSSSCREGGMPTMFTRIEKHRRSRH